MNNQELHPDTTSVASAPNPPEQASLIGIPPELRSQILEDCLNSEESVNLSKMRPLAWRNTWKKDTRRRYDPPILSVSRQLYEEASSILYRRDFVIEINCGRKGYADGIIWDSRYRGARLTGRFPFQKAKQITIRLDAHIYCDLDHVFHHMVYVCGLLLSDAKSLKNLRVEFVEEDWTYLETKCRSWENTSNIGFANHFGVVADLFPDMMDRRIAFLLQPLALGGQVDDCDITLCSQQQPYRPSEYLETTIQHYKNVLLGKEKASDEDSKWIWLEYMSILVKQEQWARRDQQAKLKIHELWLQNVHRDYDCKHPGAGKQYRRCCKKAHCEGCERWLDWLTECRKCGMRACTACKADLKEKRPELEERRQLNGGASDSNEGNSEEEDLEVCRKST